MTTLILLAILIGPWLLAQCWNRASTNHRLNTETAGRLGLTLLFLFTGVAHFFMTEPMAEMLPAWVPGRVPLVYITGWLEIAMAILVLMPAWRVATGWLIIGMLLAFLPANIYAALHGIGPGGHQWGPVYLLIRIPLQILLIGWAWRFAARKGNTASMADTAVD